MSSSERRRHAVPAVLALKTNVANFLARAERVAASPLAVKDAKFSVQMQIDLRTGDVAATRFDAQVLPKDDWLTISVKKLTSQVECEHVLLRGKLKPIRSGFAAWKRHPFAYAGDLGGTPPLDRARRSLASRSQDCNFGGR
ncbi:MAG: hypothetical protein IPJ61_04830 [Tessaracoccus sp.]|uniref:hypothetical protein n=1 Tax=Tessaracoccus sp. TaxID=1971211 RepID=UPI001EC1C58F|nr:hypothetical protein [Tessaracoccus sp.]MBK7820402.1 hypothetical protein [Tessaracoccus sp.]